MASRTVESVCGACSTYRADKSTAEMRRVSAFKDGSSQRPGPAPGIQDRVPITTSAEVQKPFRQSATPPADLQLITIAARSDKCRECCHGKSFRQHCLCYGDRAIEDGGRVQMVQPLEGWLTSVGQILISFVPEPTGAQSQLGSPRSRPAPVLSFCSPNADDRHAGDSNEPAPQRGWPSGPARRA